MLRTRKTAKPSSPISTTATRKKSTNTSRIKKLSSAKNSRITHTKNSNIQGREAYLIALDCESNGLDLRHGCKPFLVSTCTTEGETKLWEWPVDPVSRIPFIPRKDLLQIQKYLTGATLVFHHGKFDIRALSTIGIGFDFWEDDWAILPDPNCDVEPVIIQCPTFHDTLLQSHACSSSDLHGLKELSVKYLRYSDADEKELKKKVAQATLEAKRLDMEVTLGFDPTGRRETAYDYWLPRAVWPDDDTCAKYAVKDVERTILLHMVFQEAIKELNVDYGYQREKKLLQTVYRIESGGISTKPRRVTPKLAELDAKYMERHERVHRWMRRILRRPCKITSTNDLREVLYEKLKLPVHKMTPNEENPQPSTDKETIGRLMEEASTPISPHFNPKLESIFKDILIGRSYKTGVSALKSYRSFAIKDKKHSNLAWLYFGLNQSGTGTTRFSCSKPNGQNVSKISEIVDKDGRAFLDSEGNPLEGPRLRDCFGPPPGHVWYSIDYNQLELRVFAKASNEQSLMDAFDAGYDFHGFVSTQIFKKPLNQITKQERRIAKNTDFAIIFGASPWKVNVTAGMPGAYEKFAGLFPNVHRFMGSTISKVEKISRIRTLDGYQLDIPRNAPYKAVNYLVQGTAGSIIKQAMIDIDQQHLVDWINSRIVIQIHDELIIQFRKDSPQHTPRALRKIMNAMEDAGARLGITTPVSCERIETDWGHGQEVTVTSRSIEPVKKAA